MTKRELIDSIRNNRSFDLRSSEYYEPWDVLQETIKEMADDFYYLLKDVLDYLEDSEPMFKIGDTIRPKGSKAEYTITSISDGCYHGKGWGLPIGAEKDYELVESAEDIDGQTNLWNEAFKRFRDAVGNMGCGGHLPLDEDRMVPKEEIDSMAEEISKDCEKEIDRQFDEIADKHLYGKDPEMVDIDDLPLYDCRIQYASIDGAIKAHAEDYSFNIESELFQQLTPEQQKMWRKEIEQAVLSGAYSGLNLARDKRYEENRQGESVSEDLKKAAKVYEQTRNDLDVVSDNQMVERAFKAGADWQKQQMMKDAVDIIPFDINPNYGVADFWIGKQYGENLKIESSWIISQGIEINRKVKLIIFKED